MIITCPKCFSADDVQPPRGLPDHLLQYRCTNGTAHGDYEWLTTRDAVQAPGEVQEGVTVAEQGHSMLGSRAYTASSVRFGVALGRLERLGELVSEYGPATGAWHYNGQVTYWAKTVPPGRRRKSWAEYCAEIGRSPQWTDEDRLGLRAP